MRFEAAHPKILAFWTLTKVSFNPTLLRVPLISGKRWLISTLQLNLRRVFLVLEGLTLFLGIAKADNLCLSKHLCFGVVWAVRTSFSLRRCSCISSNFRSKTNRQLRKPRNRRTKSNKLTFIQFSFPPTIRIFFILLSKLICSHSA